MVMRVGGLASGMDIDALVEKLMQAERVPLDKTFQKKQTYEWQRDAYRGVNTQLTTFSNYLFDDIILSGKMNQKIGTSTNSDLVSVKANAGATGNITIGGVSQLAKASQNVGAQTGYSGSTLLKDIDSSMGSSISLRAINADGNLAEEATEITFDPNKHTVDDLVKKINESNAGVTAIFENGKLSVTAKYTGKVQDGAGEIIDESNNSVFQKLGFSDSVLSNNGQNAKFEVNGIQTERSSNTFTISGYELTLKQTFNAGEVANKSFQDAVNKLTKAEEDVVAFTDAFNHKNNALISAAQAFTEAYDNKFQNNSSLEGDYLAMDKSALKSLTSDDIATLTSLKGKSDTELATALEALPDSDTKTKLMAMDVADVERFATHSDDLAQFQDIYAKQQTSVMAEEEAKVAETELDSAKLKVEALKIEKDEAENFKNANPITGTTVAPVTMTATSDTKAAMEQITEFIDKYNEMIDSFNNQLKETKYRDFPPLTAEQRKDMSESEQKLWDEKAKSGMLRNDQIVRDGMSQMRMSLMTPMDGLSDETMNSLAKIGITTSDKLKDGGKLIIKDKAKLEEALTKDANQVHRLFASTGEKDDNGKVIESTRGIAWRLRDSMRVMSTEIEKKAGNESAVNNTFTLGKKINETDDRIKALQVKLKDIEARYWKQFSAMEQAIQKANEQAGMFAQFGQ
ncbi:hypothetical protein GCM10007425_04560 [Lysinibacillus alkalisoli]|uniref:Flagellar hook-associated protein 2 n=1 Tax=Lysinibacillus alkalisoli TaxID=1911548 RepID=A0A917FXS8_9BACI|nr:flagellar filament capping protein FliD [Lysinibacillus alkalisoli]GGG13365.1 hypothetical protein GCM10007425_04560 [Lysinibacillus alkalisoli]